jgi:hypothetical protein
MYPFEEKNHCLLIVFLKVNDYKCSFSFYLWKYYCIQQVFVYGIMAFIYGMALPLNQLPGLLSFHDMLPPLDLCLKW